ncbi:type 1 glutamine amidotransferase [Specibacter cremeus]|uniref:type 1 glutamine amidotransferase n=1 Tax=Specibacter cremeus TaxID=1629051 RepID=UPI001F0C679C|nr:gamma-glutamyl-gamma-aminobutyrate hydrolase family protein [Specibacter cremeus]
MLLITHEQTSSTDTGIVGQVLQEEGYAVQTHQMFGADPDGTPRVDVDFPSPEDIDAVIAFGSFSHVYDVAEDWIDAEIAYIAAIHRQGIPYLGICFGAQLLAESLGGRTVRSERMEVGLVTFETGYTCPVPPGPWFSWHSDKVELPEDVEVLASTPIAPQVFRSGRSIGLQFHPEVTAELLEEWLRIGGHELDGEQGKEALRQAWADQEHHAHENTRELLDWFLAGVLQPA